MTTCPTCGQPVRVEPSEEKIRAAFEAENPRDCIFDKDENGDYVLSTVQYMFEQCRRTYLAGWKDRGGG